MNSGLISAELQNHVSLDEMVLYLEAWVEAGMNDKMGYLARDIRKTA